MSRFTTLRRMYRVASSPMSALDRFNGHGVYTDPVFAETKLNALRGAGLDPEETLAVYRITIDKLV